MSPNSSYYIRPPPKNAFKMHLIILASNPPNTHNLDSLLECQYGARLETADAIPYTQD
jgi:hypothetical protein